MAEASLSSKSSLSQVRELALTSPIFVGSQSWLLKLDVIDDVRAVGLPALPRDPLLLVRASHLHTRLRGTTRQNNSD